MIAIAVIAAESRGQLAMLSHNLRQLVQVGVPVTWAQAVFVIRQGVVIGSGCLLGFALGVGTVWLARWSMSGDHTLHVPTAQLTGLCLALVGGAAAATLRGLSVLARPVNVASCDDGRPDSDS
jgi:hypothetical protein